jgi:hypothetical protein
MSVSGSVNAYIIGIAGGIYGLTGTSGISKGLEAVVNALKMFSNSQVVTTSYSGYAHGGYHPGGLRLVGESGMELEATGASRIYSHQDTISLLRESLTTSPDNQNLSMPEIVINANTSDDSYDELIAELKAVKEELKQIKRYNSQQTTLQTKTYMIIDRQDIEGVPPEREAA